MTKMAFALLPMLIMAGFMIPGNKTEEQAFHVDQVDGPYVLYQDDTVFVKYIFNDHGRKFVKQDNLMFSQKNAIVLDVLTDEPGKMFKVKLKTSLEQEDSDFKNPEKMFIVSDIEANFGAFRKLLLANNVIDSDYNWTFGKGHLVLTGDFVDRGERQNEVLWLIYSLEDKAKAAGGYVHFILGNHEIMNLNGDHRYLHKKYVEHSALLNEHFMSLYGDQSEIGRWLRTKNVVEKIGNILFCHAGISAPVNKMDLSTTKINKKVRPYYADTLYLYDSPETNVLYSDQGPFWYRGYYTGPEKATQQQIDKTLSLYKVKHIATGHTVIADTISILHGGKVINTDVHHAAGKTEALLIEGKKFYRATALGEKIPIDVQ